MRIGVPTEQFPGEHRVALVPASIAPLKKAGFDVVIERGAGERAGFPEPLGRVWRGRRPAGARG
jgi:proton-translocating NAD(P)+ transhydrogenase subunit alpha